MKLFALVAVLGLAGITPAAEAGPRPRPVSLVDRATTETRPHHYVRAERRLPRPVSFVQGKAPSSRPHHYVRGR